jgi:peroxiredoxin
VFNFSAKNVNFVSKLTIAFLALLLFSQPLVGDHEEEDKKDAGHSNHGGAWNEGPRQAAVLLPNMGDINFEISSKSDEAKKFFNQGVGQIYGFWYFEAERSFRQACMSDPESAICYWGLAQANIDNQKRARAFLVKALKFKDKASDREKRYVNSFAAFLGLPTDEKGLAAYKKTIKDKKTYKPKRSDKDRRQDYVSQLEELILEYPDDIEAKSLLALHMWFDSRRGHKIHSYFVVDALIQQVLNVRPLHPIHHFRIHLWDGRKASVALDSAAKCGFTAKGIAHMWHMSGHIYSKEKRYFDATWHQEASARVDHKHMIKYQVLPDQIHNFAHNNEWLCRNMMKLGRANDIVNLCKNMIEMPRHPKYNTLTKRGSSYYGRSRLIEVLELYELWEKAIDLCHSMYLEPTDSETEQLKRLRLLMKAYYLSGDTKAGDKIVEEVKEGQKAYLKKILDEEKKKKEKADKAKADKAKAKKTKTDKEKKGDDKKVAEKKVAEKKDEEKKPVRKKGNKKETKKKPRKKSTYEKSVDTILAEASICQMMATKIDTETLAKNMKVRGVSKRLVFTARFKAKKYEDALKYANDEVKRKKNEVVPLCLKTQVLFTSGKKEEAKKVFAELRKISQDADIKIDFFKALKPIAKEFEFPEDWRLPAVKPKDILKRPNLDDLGPFRWRPAKAGDWTLPDDKWKNVNLAAELKKQPVLLIFYLGADCLHCVEQMNVFAPKVKEYAKENIKLMAVTLEDVKTLAKTVGNYTKTGEFPFPIVADPELKVFKDYRVYDDFEKMPLHGTFLIDQEGRILWQDISYDPFIKSDFLLKECKRLLRQEATSKR